MQMVRMLVTTITTTTMITTIITRKAAEIEMTSLSVVQFTFTARKTQQIRIMTVVVVVVDVVLAVFRLDPY